MRHTTLWSASRTLDIRQYRVTVTGAVAGFRLYGVPVRRWPDHGVNTPSNLSAKVQRLIKYRRLWRTTWTCPCRRRRLGPLERSASMNLDRLDPEAISHLEYHVIGNNGHEGLTRSQGNPASKLPLGIYDVPNMVPPVRSPAHPQEIVSKHFLRDGVLKPEFPVLRRDLETIVKGQGNHRLQAAVETQNPDFQFRSLPKRHASGNGRPVRTWRVRRRKSKTRCSRCRETQGSRPPGVDDHRVLANRILVGAGPEQPGDDGPLVAHRHGQPEQNRVPPQPDRAG